MRVIVVGAGAVGSVIGGRLRQTGAAVVLVGRAAHVHAIRDSGLRLRSAQGTDVVDIDAVTSLLDLEPGNDDVVLITSKTQDAPAIHDDIRAWQPDVPVVCGTNGVEHERMALRRFAQVYGMVIQLPAQFEKPGEVTVLCAPTNALLDVGRYPHGIDDVARNLAAMIDTSPSMMSEPDADVMTKKRGKLLVNLGNSADAASGFAGRFAKVTKAAIEEAKRAYEAAGLSYEQPPGLAERYKERTATMGFDIPAGDTFLGGSTWQSLAKGATSFETDYFNGEIILLGRLHGVATPANDFLSGLATRLLRDRVAPGSVPVEALDEQWSTTR